LNIRSIILDCALITIYSFYDIFAFVLLDGAFFCPVILFPILGGGIVDRGRIDYYYLYYWPAHALLDWIAVSSIIWFIIIVIENSFFFSLSEFVLLISFDFKAWILLSVWGIPNSSIIIIRASRGQLFLIGEVILESPSELMEIWWLIAINIFRRCCHIKFLVSDVYFLKANSRGNEIFPIDDRFCDLYIKNI
jgi:hypothetical protein